MRVKTSTNVWGIAILAGVVTTFVGLPQARGELLYDEDIESTGRAQERGEVRETLGVSSRAQAAQPSYIQPAPSPVQIQPGSGPVQVQVTNASAASTSSADAEVEHVGKAELLRRSRMRVELKNEDVLQERLEELRLRDEKARTDQIIVGGAAAMASTGIQETVVVAPVTERAGRVSSEVLVADLRGGGGASTANVDAREKDEARFWVMPRVGISNMNNSDTYFEVVPHYSAGIALGVDASDNLAFELGYQFNEYGIRFGQQPMGFYPGYSFENFVMNQNVFDGSLKLHLLGRDSTFRPFIGAGAAFAQGYVNYSPNQLDMIRMTYGQAAARDYETSSYIGTLSGGVDVRVSRSISVGAMFKYNRVLSTRAADNLYAGYAFGSIGMIDPNKAIIGSQLSVSSFYSILAGAKFSF
jgi:hypothetical protein